MFYPCHCKYLRFSFLSSAGIPSMCMFYILWFLSVLEFSCSPFTVIFLPLFLPQCDLCLWRYYSQAQRSFSCSQSANKPIKDILRFGYRAVVFFIPSISLWFFPVACKPSTPIHSLFLPAVCVIHENTLAIIQSCLNS